MFRRSNNERTIAFEYTPPSLYPSSASSSKHNVHQSPRSHASASTTAKPPSIGGYHTVFSSTTRGSGTPPPIEEVELFLHVSPGGWLGRFIGRCLRLRVGRFQCVIDPERAKNDQALDSSMQQSGSTSSSSSSIPTPPFLGLRTVEVETDSIVPDMEVLPLSHKWRKMFLEEEKWIEKKEQEESKCTPSSSSMTPSSSSLSWRTTGKTAHASISPPVFAPRVPFTYLERRKIQKRLFSPDILSVDRFPLLWLEVEEEKATSIKGELYVKGIPQTVRCRKFFYSSAPPPVSHASPGLSEAGGTAAASNGTTASIASPLEELQHLQAQQRAVQEKDALNDGFLHIYCPIPNIDAFSIVKPSLWMGLFTVNSTVEVEAKIPLDLLR